MATGSNVQTTDLDVSGMTCAACQANVQRALAREPGVTDATVNLITGQARVVFDPTIVAPSRLIEAIESVGYDASLRNRSVSAVSAQAEQDRAATREYRDLRVKSTVSAVCGVAAMVISMPLMGNAAATHAHEGTGDPFMQWTMERMTPLVSSMVPWLYTISRVRLTFALFAITAFVMLWAGRRFYVNGGRALAHGAPDMNSLVAVGTGAAFA